MRLESQDPEYTRALGVLRAAAPAARQYISQKALKMNDPAFGHIDPKLKQHHSRELAQARSGHDHIDAAPGVVLESLILRAHEHGDSPGRGWLSSEKIQCRLVKTTEYDDACRGVDFLMTFTKNDGTVLLALAIDTTQSSQTQDKKVQTVVDSIRNNDPKTVEYFDDPVSEFTGRVKGVPVLLGVFDPMHVAELEVFRTENGSEALKNHPAQIMLLTELAEQARVFSQVALEAHGEDNVLYKKYSQADRIFREILSEKLTEHAWPQWGARDKAWTTLSKILSRLTIQPQNYSEPAANEIIMVPSTGVRGTPRPVVVQRTKRRIIPGPK